MPCQVDWLPNFKQHDQLVPGEGLREPGKLLTDIVHPHPLKPEQGRLAKGLKKRDH